MRASLFLLPVLCLAGSACSRQDSAAEAPVQNTQATAAAPAKSVSYEVVTVQRPESVEDYHQLYRASYDMCAQIRKAKSLPPPPPLAQPPASYITQRDTYIGDGASIYVKSEYFNFNVNTEGDTPSCASGENKSWSTEVIRNGMMYTSGADEQGNVVTNPPEQAPPPEEGRDGSYTEPKVVKGFAVKCMKLSPGTDKLLTEQCAVDLKPGSLYQGRRPIVVAGRVTIVEKMQGAMLTEPMVIRVGHQVDKRVFETTGNP